MGELSKANEKYTDQCIQPDQEDNDGAVPDLAHVSDNSQSTADNSHLEDAGVSEYSSTSTTTSASTSLAKIPSMVVKRSGDGDPSPGSASEVSSVINRSSLRCRPSVSFGTVEMKEFAMILGDHPDTEVGPAVSNEITNEVACESLSYRVR
jgi:hypothetical protein